MCHAVELASDYMWPVHRPPTRGFCCESLSITTGDPTKDGLIT